jgi:cytochrome c oxidase cbb3-type subunit 4
MDYDTVATFSQVTSLLMFIALFIAVLAYTFWPGNKERFDDVQKRALGLDDDQTDSSSRSGGAA